MLNRNNIVNIANSCLMTQREFEDVVSTILYKLYHCSAEEGQTLQLKYWCIRVLDDVTKENFKIILNYMRKTGLIELDTYTDINGNKHKSNYLTQYGKEETEGYLEYLEQCPRNHLSDIAKHMVDGGWDEVF